MVDQTKQKVWLWLFTVGAVGTSFNSVKLVFLRRRHHSAKLCQKQVSGFWEVACDEAARNGKSVQIIDRKLLLSIHTLFASTIAVVRMTGMRPELENMHSSPQISPLQCDGNYSVFLFSFHLFYVNVYHGSVGRTVCMWDNVTDWYFRTSWIQMVRTNISELFFKKTCTNIPINVTLIS